MNTYSTMDINSKKPIYILVLNSLLKLQIIILNFLIVDSENYLLSHILENFDVIFDDLTHSYTEGAAHTISITTYERNEQARNACLTHFGYACQICGLNFEEKYGPIGKDFIHVHHINFISSMQGQTHEINPETDLIPVCPNCHAMLHRKIDGIYLSPKQLKDGLSNV